MTHVSTISRDSLLASFQRFTETVAAIHRQFEALRDDPCATDAVRAAAAWLDGQLDDPVLGITLTTAPWDILRATYVETVNALKLAAGFARRLRRFELVRLARDAESKLWVLVWRRLVHVDGIGEEIAHIRLTSVDQRFRTERSTAHVA